MVEYAGSVLDELGAAVEGFAVDHVEGDVGIAVVDAFRAGCAGSRRNRIETASERLAWCLGRI